jgi:4-amino-4-deoxy-L-arabinose transferase-like glycosyltransferase
MRSTAAVALLLAVLAFALYVWRIGEAPIYASPDEMLIAVDAQHLAATGRDLGGTFLPLYFHLAPVGGEREGWFMPIVFYVVALALKVAPLSIATIRLPSVCFGVLDVVLMFLLADAIFPNRRLAIFAAVALALSPTHFILSRYALDYVYPVAFLLGWLLCLARYLRWKNPWTLLAGSVCLGVGFYSYIAAVIMMPLYVVFTALMLWRDGSRPSRYAILAAGFGVPVVPALVWVLRHPGALSSTFVRYDLYDPGSPGLLHNLHAFLNFAHIADLVSLYWSFFNPGFLFLTGDAQMMFSTRLAGVFLVAIAFLLVAGLRRAVVGPPTILGPLPWLGFVTAPLAAVVVPEPGAANRAVELLPFTVLLATLGLQDLWAVAHASAAARARALRVAAIVLLALIPAQFVVFAHDYFGDYRLRSAPWLDGNLMGALEALSARAEAQDAPAIYFATLRATSGLLDIRNRWVDRYWRFCLMRDGRQDLLPKTASWDGHSVAGMPDGALVLANIGDVPTGSLVSAGALKVVDTIPEVRGDPFFVILER